jgi:hypothetical protein
MWFRIMARMPGKHNPSATADGARIGNCSRGVEIVNQ